MDAPHDRSTAGTTTPPESAEHWLSYPVLAGAGAIDAAKDLCRPFQRVAILVDETVLGLHGERLASLREFPTFAFPPGEIHKDWNHLGRILDFMAEAQLSRDSLLLTFGGGVVSDMGGLAASIFKRGTSVAHMPTTLLSQVDASIGGKTAINLAAGKNLVGTFHSPRFVLADSNTLETQSLAEWRSGLGEVVKTTLLARPGQFAELEKQAKIMSTPASACTPALANLIQACVQTKAQWVKVDPTEQGSRKALNLGHTFAHAIEHVAGYGNIPHGIAVGLGLVLAVQTSRRVGVLVQEDLEARLLELLQNLGLPRYWSEWENHQNCALTTDAMIAGLAHDKKGGVGYPRFVLPQSLGMVVWDQELDPDTLRSSIDVWLAH